MSARKFLVVDDDPAIVDLVSMRLAIMGHEVQVARDGQMALDQVLRFRPQAMILDINMPRLDGFAVLERLGHDRLLRLPTLVLTARRQGGDVERAIRYGARDFLVKPFEDARLLQRVRRLLQG